MSEYFIGVDVGGTKVAAGLVDASGNVRTMTRTPMLATGTAEEGLAAVRKAIDSLLQGVDPAQVAGIGICSPGPLDPFTGVVINPPNLPCWHGFPLAGSVRNIYSVPVKVDNDANAAALAEAQWGAGIGYRNVFYATLGTGIGTGILFDKKIFHGRTGAAAEGGHNSIDYRGPRCGCGKPGCIEILAAGPAIGRRARQALSERDAKSTMLDLAQGDIQRVTAEIVGEAYRAGDPLAAAVLRETLHLLAVWFGNIVDLLEPDVIIIGGGVSMMLSPMFPDLIAEIPKYCINPRANEIPLVHARYGQDAGIAGAAALCTL
jgi:glucokinase